MSPQVEHLALETLPRALVHCADSASLMRFKTLRINAKLYLVLLSKLWFIDRMVWLYEDMKDANPEY
ncbi:MAG: hypothetical protein HC862_15300 [Scytonema sp. RU_4_4]|nr:hypothetical protein [Scytonema sp. RU_4_4]NJR73832.1 hypothetical protein [Scytonema sp. CRU_2_7]